MKKKHAVLIILWILSIAGISFYGGRISYGFFYAVTLTPVLCLFYIAAVIIRFRVYQSVGSRDLVCDQPEAYYFILHNQDFFAFSAMKLYMFSSFSEVKDIDDQAVYELLPKTRIKLDTEIICKYRGEYEVGIREIEFSDFLNLFSVKYKIPGSVKVFVEPKLVEMDSIKSFDEIQEFVNIDSFRDRTDQDCTVRDYQEGDPLKRVHWKATAKEMKLKVRTQKSDEQQRIFILLDTERAERDKNIYIPEESKLLETAIAITYYLFRKGISQKLCYMGQDFKKISPDERHDFDQYRRELSRMSFDKQNRPEVLFAEALHDPEVLLCRVMILLLFGVTPETENMCAELNDRGIYLIIYVITEDETVIHALRADERRTIRVILPDCDLREVL
jgi:uncharacterized protein (DUF58 family)